MDQGRHVGDRRFIWDCFFKVVGQFLVVRQIFFELLEIGLELLLYKLRGPSEMGQEGVEVLFEQMSLGGYKDGFHVRSSSSAIIK